MLDTLAMDTGFSRTQPHNPPLNRDDILEIAREQNIAQMGDTDGHYDFDYEEIWDIAAANGIVPARPADWKDHAVPGDVALLWVDAEMYCHT